MIFVISSTKIALWEMASSHISKVTFVIIHKMPEAALEIKDKLV